MEGLFQEQSYLQRYQQRIWAKCGGRNSAGPRDQSPLWVPLSLSAQQTLIYQAFAFLSPGQLLSSPLKSQTTTLNMLLHL